MHNIYNAKIIHGNNASLALTWEKKYRGRKLKWFFLFKIFF